MDDETSQRHVAAILASQSIAIFPYFAGESAAKRVVRIYREVLAELESVEKDEILARRASKLVNDHINSRS